MRSRTSTSRSAGRSIVATVVAAVVMLTAVPLAATSTGQSAAAETEYGTDVARTGTATAKSTYLFTGEPAGYAPANSIDGDATTRWGSRYTRTGPNDTYDARNDWLQVALAEPTTIDHVSITWEGAASVDYFVQGSTNGTDWVELAHPTGTGARTDEVAVSDSSPYAFVRMLSNNNASKWGLSIFSFEIWDGPKPPPPPAGVIVPAPVEQRPLADESPFTLTRESRIAVDDAALLPVAELLAARLRASTGYPLEIVSTDATPADIALALGDPVASAPTAVAEAQAYTLLASADAGVRITGSDANGLFNGTQTLLQLLPAWALSNEVRIADWTVPAISVVDYPRIQQRGLMIDPARQFISVPEVKTIIDRLALMKGNRLHMHLSDDEGWRLEIAARPKLTEVGATWSYSGAEGLTGFYSQDDFREIVAYANARFVEVIPEFDMPGHSDATLASYPELVCDSQAAVLTERQKGIPIRDSRRPATFVPLCATEESTYDFVADVLDELVEISPSEFIHIGADEVDPTYMSHSDYLTFIRRVEAMVAERGKRLIGWTPSPIAMQLDSSVHQYWADRKNQIPTVSQDGEHLWYSRGSDVVLSPTNHAYLDYQFQSGMSWGWKGSRWTTRASYNWDPSRVIDESTADDQNALGLQESQITAVEGAIWGETMRAGLTSIDYMVWTRLAGLIEKAWSPKTASGDWSVYARRLATMGPRWQVDGANFYADPEVPWASTVSGNRLQQASLDGVSGVVAEIAAPSARIATLSATIAWGDGETSIGTLTGQEAKLQDAASLFQVAGQHAYRTAGEHRGAVEITLADGSRSTAPFIVEVPTSAVPADHSALDDAITDARSLLAATDVGDQVGQVRPADAATFAAAIDAAAAANAAAVTQADVDVAVAALGGAIATFRDAILTEDDFARPIVVTVDGAAPDRLQRWAERELDIAVVEAASTVVVSLEQRRGVTPIAQLTADDDGRAAGEIRVPGDTLPGPATLVVTGRDSIGNAFELRYAILVTGGKPPLS